MQTNLNSNIDIFGNKLEYQKIQNSNMKNLDIEKAKETSTDFEAFVLSKMFSTMFETVSTDGMFGAGNAERIYRSLLVDEYGKIIAKNGGVGVADSVMDTIIKMQEQNQEINNEEI